VIIGTIVPLYFHLLQNNEYFSLVSFLISVYVLLTLVQLGCKFESRVWCYCNILTILSNFLGPSTCIPIILWVGITFIYQICMFVHL
ncbi:unnamed protein product, partial [Brassica oleracea var. botrytis]